MWNHIITHLQIFGIGFSFGIAGPCFLFCTPILVTYIVGRKERMPEAVLDILAFLSGRLAAYVVLGALAGLSGSVLRHFIEPRAVSAFINPVTGVVSIILGIFVLIYKEPMACSCVTAARKVYGFGSLVALGFVLGISPCAPLTALLLEIALMSKSVFDGMLYAFSFGLGTMLSGLLVVGALTGIIKGAANKLVKSKNATGAFRVACSGLLIMLGAWLIISNMVIKP